MNFQVDIDSEEGLSSEQWTFTVHTWPCPCLTRYEKMKREKKRHKFWRIGAWSAYDNRISPSIEKPSIIPRHVIADVRRQVAEFVNSGSIYIGARISVENLYEEGEK